MLLRCLIVAFTGDQAAAVLEEVPGKLPVKIERSAAVAAMQTVDLQLGAGWQLVMGASGF